MRKLIKAFCLIFVLCISVSVLACDVGIDHPTPTNSDYFEVVKVGESYEISAKAGAELPSSVILPTTWTVTNADSSTETVNITKVADGAFIGSKCTKISIPEGYTQIGAYAFQNCFSLTAIELPGTVEALGQGAFSGCTGYKNTLYIPDSVINIGNNCFELCTSLSVVSVPKNCTLGTDLTKGCSKLEIDIRNK